MPFPGGKGADVKGSIAVRTVAETKYGPRGILDGLVGRSAWRDLEAVAAGTLRTSEAAIRAAAEYAEYVHRRYGRFPAHAPPLRTVLGFQVNRPDPVFYETHFRPETHGVNEEDAGGSPRPRR